MNVNRSHWLRLLVVGWVLAAATRPGQALMISEIMYHPVDERLEFIELHNPRAVVEDLGGFVLTGAVEYVFDPDVTLAAGATLAVALDPEALGEVYDVPQLLGPYTGRLSNGGERVELRNSNNGIVASVRYRDTHPWPVAADGTGHSLVLPGAAADPEAGGAWRASAVIGGSPGRPEVPAGSGGTLRINEIMADGSDWVEVYNPGPAAFDLSGIASHVLAVLVQHRMLALQGVESHNGGHVPDVGVLGHRAQSLLLAATTDKDRQSLLNRFRVEYRLLKRVAAILGRRHRLAI